MEICTYNSNDYLYLAMHPQLDESVLLANCQFQLSFDNRNIANTLIIVPVNFVQANGSLLSECHLFPK